MSRGSVLAIARAAFAALVVFAIVVQMATNIAAGTFDPTRFFAFFTIESNIYGAVLFLFLAVRRPAARSAMLDLLRGAAVVYLMATFVVVVLFLSGADLQVAIPWVDFTLHKIFPIVVVVDWLIDPPATRLTAGQGARWLAYPLIWVTLTLLRGAVNGWYPYPFLDPANGGYTSVAVAFVTILGLFVAFAVATLVIGNAARGRMLTSR